MPTKAKHLHEMALRIVLHALESSANRYKRHIVPVLSCSIDFYVRLFVRVFESPAEVKLACMKMSYVYQSINCPSFYLQPVARQNKNSFVAPLVSLSDTTCAEVPLPATAPPALEHTPSQHPL